MNHASLFSGIGGFDLAAREVGWNNVFQCEIDPFCQSVLKYYFPKTVLYEDIKRTDFTSWKGKIDVLTGGFGEFENLVERLFNEAKKNLL